MRAPTLGRAAHGKGNADRRGEMQGTAKDRQVTALNCREQPRRSDEKSSDEMLSNGTAWSGDAKTQHGIDAQRKGQAWTSKALMGKGRAKHGIDSQRNGSAGNCQAMQRHGIDWQRNAQHSHSIEKVSKDEWGDEKWKTDSET